MKTQPTPGQRALACKRWRWMDGMLALRPRDDEGFYRYRLDQYAAGVVAWHADTFHLKKIGALCVPDLTDPATLGCLLELVREVWGDEWLTPTRHDEAFDFFDGGCNRGWAYACGTVDGAWATEAEALVAALEAA